ncbi:MAG: hypothetical protein ABSF08_06140 [Candidatus Cybelea sp.]
MRCSATGCRVPLSLRNFTAPARVGPLAMFWWVIVVVAGFLILRTIVRAVAASRHFGGATRPGPAEYGYGGFGGGGSFWSGLLGGLGGAWLGSANDSGARKHDSASDGDAGGGSGDGGGGW